MGGTYEEAEMMTLTEKIFKENDRLNYYVIVLEKTFSFHVDQTLLSNNLEKEIENFFLKNGVKTKKIEKNFGGGGIGESIFQIIKEIINTLLTVKSFIEFLEILNGLYNYLVLHINNRFTPKNIIFSTIFTNGKYGNNSKLLKKYGYENLIKQDMLVIINLCFELHKNLSEKFCLHKHYFDIHLPNSAYNFTLHLIMNYHNFNDFNQLRLNNSINALTFFEEQDITYSFTGPFLKRVDSFKSSKSQTYYLFLSSSVLKDLKIFEKLKNLKEKVLKLLKIK